MEKLLAVDTEAWLAELDSIGEFFDQFGTRMPERIWAQHEALREAPARGEEAAANAREPATDSANAEGWRPAGPPALIPRPSTPP